MAIRTKDHAKIGNTYYVVQWVWADEMDPWGFYEDRADLATLDEAKAWAERTMPAASHDDSESGHWRVSVELGTWIEDVLPDDEYGTILDAVFEYDETFHGYGFFEDGRLCWDIDTE